MFSVPFLAIPSPWISTLTMLGLVSVLIIAHELGHLWVARKCGIKVERFGLGLPFGPVLFSKTYGGIEFVIHAALFGGYVAFPDDNPDSPVPADSKERFENQGWWQRFAVAIAGITVNAILGWAIMVWVAMQWGMPVISGVRMMDFVSAASPAAVAGFQKGDLIDRVGAYDIKAESGQMKLSRVITTIRQSAGKPLAITVLRGVPLETKASAKGYAGKTTTQSGVKSGAKPSATSSLQAQGTPVTITVTPNTNGQIGVQLKPEGAGVERITNPLKASAASATFLWEYVVKNFEGIGWLLTGKIAPTELSGPVRIIEEGGRMIEESGFQNGLILTAIISVILAVMNLLPIPALDGGHILFLLIEAIKGSPVKKSIQDGCIQGGFVVLMLFMGVVLVNDVLHLFK